MKNHFLETTLFLCGAVGAGVVRHTGCYKPKLLK